MTFSIFHPFDISLRHIGTTESLKKIFIVEKDFETTHKLETLLRNLNDKMGNIDCTGKYEIQCDCNSRYFKEYFKRS